MALAAEEVGFDSVWVGDHYLYRGDDRPERGPWEAWTLLAGLATVTRRVRLGPLVACLNFHPPAVLAEIAATVDELSDGPFIGAEGGCAGWFPRRCGRTAGRPGGRSPRSIGPPRSARGVRRRRRGRGDPGVRSDHRDVDPRARRTARLTP